MKIDDKRIIHGEIGRGIKVINKDGNIIRETFKCGNINCDRELSKEEVKRYEDLKGKISTSHMLCSDCRKKYKINL